MQTLRDFWAGVCYFDAWRIGCLEQVEQSGGHVGCNGRICCIENVYLSRKNCTKHYVLKVHYGKIFSAGAQVNTKIL